MAFEHVSVLLNETVDGLNVKPDGVYVDATLGGGGHAYEVCRRLGSKGRFIGIDQDADAIKAAGERLKGFGEKVTIIRSNYRDMKPLLHNMLCNILSKFIFPIVADHTVKFRLTVFVDNVSRRHFLSLIHSHIKRRIHPIRKSAFGGIKLV